MLGSVPDLQQRFNIAPTQETLIVHAANNQREGAMMRWGLIPSWAKDPRIGASMINARSETVAEKPAFRAAFRRRRCLVIVDGYYEWKRAGKANIPHLYDDADGQLLALAGIWEAWESMRTFSILTTTANSLAAAIHDRMPVVLSEADSAQWLNPNSELADLQPLLEPCPRDLLQVREVSPFVNNARNEGPQCVAPLLF